jgi:hypothetical protein
MLNLLFSILFSLFNQRYFLPSYVDVLLLSPQIAVHLPNKSTVDGFLGLYDNDIAIIAAINNRTNGSVGIGRGREYNASDRALVAGRCLRMQVDGCRWTFAWRRLIVFIRLWLNDGITVNFFFLVSDLAR